MLRHLGQAAAIATKKFGDKEALIFEDRSFTFTELNDLVERTAAGLSDAGFRPGDIVTLYAAIHGNGSSATMRLPAQVRLSILSTPC